MSGSAPGRGTLRRRLTLVTAGTLALALTAGAVLLVQLVTAQRIDSLDEAVTGRVETVRDLLVTDRVPESLAVGTPGEVVQLLDPSGAVLATSANGSMTLPVVDAETLAELGGSAGADPVVATAASPYAGQARVAVLAVPDTEVPQDWPTEPGPAGSGVFVVAAVPMADVNQTSRTLSLLLVGVVPVLVIGLGLAVWFVLGRALRPVEDLRAAAAEVAATGGPGSLPVPPTGELAALAETLNAMLDRLDEAAAAERAAAQTARDAADRQRAFVADAAHELRSPLASMVTALEVAQRHPDAYPQEELLAVLGSDVDRLRALVDDLLLLARVGSRPLRLVPLDLAESTTDVVEALADGRSDVVVRVEGAGTGEGDAAAVDRVLRNLLANAVRHARGDVEITVDAGSVTIDDDGAGIPADQRERVFERFVRLDEARERDAGGSGLGLAIARELAREQGGDVTVGESPTGGLRAVLTLPTA